MNEVECADMKLAESLKEQTTIFILFLRKWSALKTYLHTSYRLSRIYLGIYIIINVKKRYSLGREQRKFWLCNFWINLTILSTSCCINLSLKNFILGTTCPEPQTPTHTTPSLFIQLHSVFSFQSLAL